MVPKAPMWNTIYPTIKNTMSYWNSISLCIDKRSMPDINEHMENSFMCKERRFVLFGALPSPNSGGKEEGILKFASMPPRNLVEVVVVVVVVLVSLINKSIYIHMYLCTYRKKGSERQREREREREREIEMLSTYMSLFLSLSLSLSVYICLHIHNWIYCLLSCLL